MSTREQVAVADLIPGDTLIPSGIPVVGYPYGLSLPGTHVPCEPHPGIHITYYYPSPEVQVQVLRD